MKHAGFDFDMQFVRDYASMKMLKFCELSFLTEYWEHRDNVIGQTSADKDSESPDSSISSGLAGQTDIGQHLLQNSGQDRDRQNSNRQTLERIRAADRHRTRFFGKSGQKPDKDRRMIVLSADVWYEIPNYGDKRIFYITQKLATVSLVTKMLY